MDLPRSTAAAPGSWSSSATAACRPPTDPRVISRTLPLPAPASLFPTDTPSTSPTTPTQPLTPYKDVARCDQNQGHRGAPSLNSDAEDEVNKMSLGHLLAAAPRPPPSVPVGLPHLELPAARADHPLHIVPTCAASSDSRERRLPSATPFNRDSADNSVRRPHAALPPAPCQPPPPAPHLQRRHESRAPFPLASSPRVALRRHGETDPPSPVTIPRSCSGEPDALSSSNNAGPAVPRPYHSSGARTDAGAMSNCVGGTSSEAQLAPPPPPPPPPVLPRHTQHSVRAVRSEDLDTATVGASYCQRPAQALPLPQADDGHGAVGRRSYERHSHVHGYYAATDGGTYLPGTSPQRDGPRFAHGVSAFDGSIETASMSLQQRPPPQSSGGAPSVGTAAPVSRLYEYAPYDCAPYADGGPAHPQGQLGHVARLTIREPKPKRPWSEREDAQLRELVHSMGVGMWAAIAHHIPGRTGKQVRERWLNHLSPSVVKRPWSAEEDRIILQTHTQFGNAWSKIAKMLNGRSDNSVKNRYYTTLRRRYSPGSPGSASPPAADKSSYRARSDYDMFTEADVGMGVLKRHADDIPAAHVRVKRLRAIDSGNAQQ